jgi:hypothetical protein
MQSLAQAAAAEVKIGQEPRSRYVQVTNEAFICYQFTDIIE